MEILRDLGIAMTTCAILGMFMGRSERYAGRRLKGFAVGLLAGLLVLLPLAGIVLLLCIPALPDGIIDASIVAVVLYEITLWARLVRHAQCPAGDSASRPVPDLKTEGASLEFLENERTVA